MALLDELTMTLAAEGYTEDTAAKTAAQSQADTEGMSALYPYVIHHVFKKDDVVIVVEQNTSAEAAGGLTSIIEHPPVCKISGPGGRTTVSAGDVPAVVAVAAQLG